MQGSCTHEGVHLMLSYRLVRLIESHAEALASGLEIYRHLGERLLGKNELDIEQRYREIGARRAVPEVPLSEVIQVIVLTKENLWDFLKSEGVMDCAIEITPELELLQMLEMFFDRAIYYATVGYEEEIARVSRESGLRAR